MNPLTLFKFLPTVLKGIGKITGLNILNDAADAITGTKLTPEQAQAMSQLDLEKLKVELDAEKAEIESASRVDVAMLTNPDKYTVRARPTSLYMATACTTFLIVIVGICLLKEIKIDWEGIGSMVALIAPMWGQGIIYTRARRDEKLAAMNNNV